jgi:UDP-glucose 4-epimerase
MSRICVTGGAGFIGSHVADAFVANGHEVLVIDDLSSGRKENVPLGAKLEVVDIRSQQAAPLLIDRRIEVVVHHAAQMDIRRSVEDPVFDASVNLLGLLNLMEAARRGEVRQVVFASTGGAIYGEQDFFPADEEHPVRPISPYGVAKLASERYLYYYFMEHNIEATCLRYANVYGPRQSPHGEAGVVAIFIHRLLAGQQPVINGSGEQTRDYVFVRDVVAANLAAIGQTGFRVYNVGTGVETDVNVLFSAIREAVGQGPDASHGPAKPGEQKRSCISAGRIASELGVRIVTSLREGLAETAEWFASR